MSENPNPSHEHLDDVVKAKMKGLGLDALFHQVDKKRKDDDGPFDKRHPDPDDKRLYARLKYGGAPRPCRRQSLKDRLLPRRIPHVIIDAGMTTLTICVAEGERDKTIITRAYHLEIPVHLAHQADKWQRFIVEALRQHLPERLLSTARITTLVPRAQAILKFIILPTARHDEIKKMIAFETQHHIPLALADIEMDYAVLKKEVQGTHVLIAAVKKDDIARHLRLLAEAGVVPDRVETSAGALYNAAREQSDKEDLVLQVHVGAATTDINICRAGGWRFSRGITWGSFYLTRRLAERLNVSLDDAEKIKRDNGILLRKKEDGPTDRMISDEARAWADVLVNEMRWTLENFQMEKGLENVNQIVLSGGGALLNNLNEYLKERLKSRIVFIKPPAGLSWQGNLDVDDAKAMAYALCWGLAAPGEARGAVSLNLLPAPQKIESAHRTAVRRRTKSALILAPALLIALLAGLLLWQGQSLRLENLQRQLRHLQEEAAAVDDLKARLRTIEDYLAGQHTSLGTLREISLLTPPAITIDQFLFEKNREITLAGRAPSHAAAVDFAGALNESPLLANATLRYATQTQRRTDGSQEVHFEITCALNPAQRNL